MNLVGKRWTFYMDWWLQHEGIVVESLSFLNAANLLDRLKYLQLNLQVSLLKMTEKAVAKILGRWPWDGENPSD